MSASLSTRLDAIRSLAEVAPSALPLGTNAIFVNEDGILGIAEPPRRSRLRFVVGGLPFQAAVSPEGGRSVCQIWAEVGHIPYTAQAPDRRRNLLAILRGIDGLKHARFIVQDGQKILLFSESHVDGHVTPEDLVYRMVCVMREARPFLRLLGEHL